MQKTNINKSLPWRKAKWKISLFQVPRLILTQHCQHLLITISNWTEYRAQKQTLEYVDIDVDKSVTAE